MNRYQLSGHNTETHSQSYYNTAEVIQTVIIGAHKCPGLVVGAVDVIPPAGLPVVLVIAHHLQAVLLRPSVGFPLGEVGEAPGLVVQPPPAALQVLVSSAQEYRVVEVWVSWKVKMEVK